MIDQTETHNLADADAPVVAAMRIAYAAGKGVTIEPEARLGFDAMIAMTSAIPDVRIEAGSIGGVSGWWCRTPSAQPDAYLLYFHGGGYVLGSARAFCPIASQLAQRAGADTFVPDYRLAPEHPFPAAIDDCWAVYCGLVQEGATTIALAGESAGGGLALAILSLAASSGGIWPGPCGAAVLSPWTDLALTGDSHRTRAAADPLFTQASLAGLAEQYLQGHDATDPKASPLYAPLQNLPPIRIDVGDDEILLDDSTRYAERARAAGTSMVLSVWTGMPHVFPAHIGKLTAADAAIDMIGQFLRARLNVTPKNQR